MCIHKTESEILNILPSYLQHDIHTYVSKQFLMQLNIFRNEWIELPDFIIGLIAVKTKSISCNQNYKLYDIGDQAKEFYIQRTGRSVLLDKNGTEIHDLSRGNVCGEVMLFVLGNIFKNKYLFFLFPKVFEYFIQTKKAKNTMQNME